MNVCMCISDKFHLKKTWRGFFLDIPMESKAFNFGKCSVLLADKFWI